MEYSKYRAGRVGKTGITKSRDCEQKMNIKWNTGRPYSTPYQLPTVPGTPSVLIIVPVPVVDSATSRYRRYPGYLLCLLLFLLSGGPTSCEPHTMIEPLPQAVMGAPGEPPPSPPSKQQPKNQLVAARLSCKRVTAEI